MRADALQDRVAEVERLAEGWKRSLRVCARLKRLDEGRPLIEIVRDRIAPGPA